MYATVNKIMVISYAEYKYSVEQNPTWKADNYAQSRYSPCLQKFVTGSYPEPDESTPHSPTLFSKDPF